MTVGVVGLGRIGAPLAACLAASGQDVLGIDIDAAKVDAVNAGQAPVDEPGLAELIASAPFEATTDVAGGLDRCEVAFLVLPTRSTEDGTIFVPGLDDIAATLRDSKCGLVALVSTVPPGTVRAFQAKVGKPVCFTPEFIALGTVIRDFREPAFALIAGEESPRVESILRPIWRNSPPVMHMTYEEAEVAKLALNAYLATKVSFANVVAGLCSRLPDCDRVNVAAALELDPRVGRGFLVGGAAFGGPCLPRDTVALAAFDDSGLFDAVLRRNELSIDELCGRVRDAVPAGGRIALCGIGFKHGVGVVEASPALPVAARLADAGYDVVGVDASVDANDVPFAMVPTTEGCDAAVLLTRDDFGKLSTPVVIDWWA